MTKSFKVAGHVFSLTLQDGSPLWEKLGQYDPFLVDSGDSLFEVRLTEELPAGRRELVFGPETKRGAVDFPDMSEGRADGGLHHIS